MLFTFESKFFKFGFQNPVKISTMERFAQIVNGLKSLTIFTKRSTNTSQRIN